MSEPTPALADGDHYREMAGRLRALPRDTRSPGIRRELVEFVRALWLGHRPVVPTDRAKLACYPDEVATRARDRPLLADVTAAAASTFDVDAGRDLPVRLAFGIPAASTAAGETIGVCVGTAGVASLRPKPRAFAIVERCSE